MPHNSSKSVSIAQNDLINGKLPDEILIQIFSFLGPEKRNSHYLLLARVCRRWRTIVLHNSPFWTSLCYDRRWGTKESMDRFEIMYRRSGSQPLDIFVADDFDYNHSRHWLEHFQTLDLSRIRSLFLEISYDIRSEADYFPDILIPNTAMWSDILVPNLKNLSFVLTKWVTIDVEPVLQFLSRLISTSRLQYLRIPGPFLSYLHDRVFQHLSHVEWLKLDQELIGSPFADEWEVLELPPHLDILKSLEKLPNLQFLNYDSDPRNRPTTSNEVITLPNLRMLSLNNCSDFFCTVEMPDLDYFSTFQRAAWQDIPDDRLLYNFDFSNTNIITICMAFCHRVHVALPSYFVACISGKDSSMATPKDCASFAEFSEGLPFGATLNGHLELPKNNSFHFVYEWYLERMPNPVPIPLRLATALMELTVDTTTHEKQRRNIWPFLVDILRSAKTITSLNIINTSVGLVKVCKLLEEEPGITPRLERLTYHSAHRAKPTSFLALLLKTVQSVRFKASSQPLKVLRAQNFFTVPYDQVQAIERLGIEYIQV